jgi:hypothetical protein
MLLGTKAHEHRIFVIGGSFPGLLPFTSLLASPSIPTLSLLSVSCGALRVANVEF